MDDLIYRQAAIDALHGYFDGMLETDTWSPCDVYGLIETLPSAVVRCKDCKYFDSGTDEDGKLFFKCLGWVYGGTSEDDFCSHGERK